MAWIEDRWVKTVKALDGSKTQEPSTRHGIGLRWRVRYETPDGIERSRSFARKPGADNFLTQVAADLLRGTYRDPDAGKITLRKYSAQWLAAQSMDDTSRETIQFRLGHILSGLGSKRLDQLAASPMLIQGWLKGLRLAPSTCRQCLATLSSIFASAIDEGKIASNPCHAKSVRPPELVRRKVIPLEAADLAALREAMPGRFEAMINLGAWCGLRQGEIFGISPDDIDFLRRGIQVRRQVKLVGGVLVFSLPKRRKTRDVPLPQVASLALAEHIRLFPPRPVTLAWHEPGARQHGKPSRQSLMFTTPVTARALSRNAFNAGTWKPALRKAGLPATRDNGMHVLRHSYASALLANGVDIRQVAACLGHEDPAFTLNVYAHLMKGGDERVRRAIDLAASVPQPYPSKIESR
jgi:integrase